LDKIYTDRNPKLKDLGILFNSQEFIHFLRGNLDAMEEYRNSMMRVHPENVRAHLNEFLAPYGMEITREVSHAHNIGNNNSYSVLDPERNETFARVNINVDPFGKGFCFATDICEKPVSNTYELGGFNRLQIHHFTPDWSEYAFRGAPHYDAEKMVEKEVVLHVRVPNDFDREDERALDDAISALLSENGYELVDSKEYRDLEKTSSALDSMLAEAEEKAMRPDPPGLEKGLGLDLDI